MTQHTPGPWRYIAQAPSKLDRVGTAMVATTHSGGLAIDCHGSGRSWQEDAANARLVAAAPDMAEALRAVQLAHAKQIEWNAAMLLVDAALRAAATGTPT